MDIQSMYGQVSQRDENKKVEDKVQTNINFSSKQVRNEIPKGARIDKVRKDINVEEIENGWIKSVSTDTEYSVRENDGDWEKGYCYNNEKYFSKEKPVDITLTYAM